MLVSPVICWLLEELLEQNNLVAEVPWKPVSFIPTQRQEVVCLPQMHGEKLTIRKCPNPGKVNWWSVLHGPRDILNPPDGTTCLFQSPWRALLLPGHIWLQVRWRSPSRAQALLYHLPNGQRHYNTFPPSLVLFSHPPALKEDRACPRHHLFNALKTSMVAIFITVCFRFSSSLEALTSTLPVAATTTALPRAGCSFIKQGLLESLRFLPHTMLVCRWVIHIFYLQSWKHNRFILQKMAEGS